MARTETILAAIQRIHEAPLAPDGWSEALPALAQVVGSPHAFVVVEDVASTSAEFAAGANLSPEHLALFADNLRRLPPWAHTLPAGTVTRSSAMMPDRLFARSVFYNEAVRPLGDFYGLAAVPLRAADRRIYLATGRALGSPDYESEDVAALTALVPHVLTALRVTLRLGDAGLMAAKASAALDGVAGGVILVAADSRILFANRFADAVLTASAGLDCDESGLRASEPRASAHLRRLIAACAKPDGHGGTVLVTRPGQAPLRVAVAPFRSPEPWPGRVRPAAIVTIPDPDQDRRRRAEDLRRRYRLTAAEAAVAIEIARGDGRAGAAARLGITAATVQTHLARIFEKTGVHRQAELVRLLLLDPDGG